MTIADDLDLLDRTASELLAQGYRIFVLDLRNVLDSDRAPLWAILRLYTWVTRQGGRLYIRVKGHARRFRIEIDPHHLPNMPQRTGWLGTMGYIAMRTRLLKQSQNLEMDGCGPFESLDPFMPRLTDPRRTTLFWTACFTLLVVWVIVLWRLTGVFKS